MEIKVSILDYLGKIETGILVLISLVYNGKCFEGTFFYTDEQILLNVDDTLEELIGCEIKNHKEYTDILRFLIKNVVPWGEMINRMDEVDFSIYGPKEEVEKIYLAGDVDPSEITSATQS